MFIESKPNSLFSCFLYLGYDQFLMQAAGRSLSVRAAASGVGSGVSALVPRVRALHHSNTLTAHSQRRFSSLAPSTRRPRTSTPLSAFSMPPTHLAAQRRAYHKVTVHGEVMSDPQLITVTPKNAEAQAVEPWGGPRTLHMANFIVCTKRPPMGKGGESTRSRPPVSQLRDVDHADSRPGDRTGDLSLDTAPSDPPPSERVWWRVTAWGALAQIASRLRAGRE